MLKGEVIHSGDEQEAMVLPLPSSAALGMLETPPQSASWVLKENG